MLACLKSGQASSADIRDALVRSKSISSKLVAFQTTAAAAVARRERHGDGGASMLHNSVGVSRYRARKQVKTADELRKLPSVREAVEEGEISFANADTLAKASRNTSPEAVQTDPELLLQARTMPEDKFIKQTRRWAAQRQRDRGEADFARKRARRSLRIWDGDDGMTHLKGEFDPVTGAKIRSRLNKAALQFYRGDKKRAAAGAGGAGFNDTVTVGSGGSNSRGPVEITRRNNGFQGVKRSFEQCCADALEKLIAGGGTLGAGVDASAGVNAGGGRDTLGTTAGRGAANKRGSLAIGGFGFEGDSSHNTEAHSEGTNGNGKGVVDSGYSSDAGGDDTVNGSCGCGISGSSLPSADILVFADISAFNPDNDANTKDAAEANGGLDFTSRIPHDDTSTAVGTGSGHYPQDFTSRIPHDDILRKSHIFRQRTKGSSEEGWDVPPPPQQLQQRTKGISEEGWDSSSDELGVGGSSPGGDGSSSSGRWGGLIEIAGGGTIPPSVFEWLLCNASVTGVLFDGPGRPLWCGRSRRTVNGAQLKALKLRDRGCIGCGAHPSICQAHHIVPWSQGGKTDLENLVLVCYECHHNIHDKGWKVTTNSPTTPLASQNSKTPNNVIPASLSDGRL